MKRIFYIATLALSIITLGLSSVMVQAAYVTQLSTCPSNTKFFKTSPGTNSNWSKDIPCCNSTANDGLYSTCVAKQKVAPNTNTAR